MAGNEVQILVSAKDEASAKLAALKGKVGGLSSALGTALKRGALVGGVALAGLGAASIKMAADFEKSFAEVKTLLPGLSEEAFGKLQADLLAFSKEMGIATSQSVPALYQAISAGVPPENVMTFMEIASKAAIGGVTDLETAVDGLSSVVNAYGADVISAQEAADVMFTGVKLGKTTFEELSASLFNVVPIAAATGVRFEEVTAALAGLTAQGVPTNVATTQLRAAIQALSAPTIRQEKLMKELGLEFSAEALQAKGLAGAFGEVIEASGGNMAVLRKLIGSVEGVQAVLALGGKGAEGFADALAEMERSTGAVDKAFDTIAETASFKFGRAFNRLKITLMEVGLRILPHLSTAIDKVSQFFDRAIPVLRAWWAEHGPGIRDAFQQVADILTMVASVVGQFLAPALDTLRDLWSNLQPLVEAVIGFFKENETAVKALAISLGVLATAIIAITNPWLAVITVLAIVLAKWDEISQTFTKTIPNAIDDLIAKIREIPVLGEIFEETFKAIQNVIEVVFGIIVPLVEANLKAIANQFQLTFDTIDAIFKIFEGIFTGDFTLFLEGLKQLVMAPLEFIRRQFEILWELVDELTRGKLTEIKEVVVTGIENLGTAIADTASKVVAAVAKLAADVLNAIVSFLGYDSMVLLGRKIVQGLWDGIATLDDWLFRKAKSFAKGIFNAVKDGLGKLWPFSPSRAGIDIGRGLGEGFGLGIISSLPIVEGVIANFKSLIPGAEFGSERGKALALAFSEGVLDLKFPELTVPTVKPPLLPSGDGGAGGDIPRGSEGVQAIIGGQTYVSRGGQWVPTSGFVPIGNTPTEIEGPVIPMQRGGIARRPTLALLGEAGPEAVVPLGAGAKAGSDVHIHFHAPVYGLMHFRDVVNEIVRDTGLHGGYRGVFVTPGE